GRPLYAHHDHAWLSATHDQQLGGAIMLLVGGGAYLLGALGLLRESLAEAAPRGSPGRAPSSRSCSGSASWPAASRCPASHRPRRGTATGGSRTRSRTSGRSR